jgi:hypothetical protein
MIGTLDDIDLSSKEDAFQQAMPSILKLPVPSEVQLYGESKYSSLW